MHPLAALHGFTHAGINCLLHTLHFLLIITIIGYSIALGVKSSAVNWFFNQLSSFLIKCSVSYSLFQ